jgi:hypothetical protein
MMTNLFTWRTIHISLVVLGLILWQTPVWFWGFAASISVFVVTFIVFQKRDKQKALASRTRAHAELSKFGLLYSLPAIQDEVKRMLVIYSEELQEIDAQTKMRSVNWKDIESEFRSSADAIVNDSFRLESQSREYVMACEESPRQKHELDLMFKYVGDLIEVSSGRDAFAHATASSRYWDARAMFEEGNSLTSHPRDTVKRYKDTVKRYHLFIAAKMKLDSAEEVARAALHRPNIKKC